MWVLTAQVLKAPYQLGTGHRVVLQPLREPVVIYCLIRGVCAKVVVEVSEHPYSLYSTCSHISPKIPSVVTEDLCPYSVKSLWCGSSLRKASL